MGIFLLKDFIEQLRRHVYKQLYFDMGSGNCLKRSKIKVLWDPKARGQNFQLVREKILYEYKILKPLTKKHMLLRN